MPTFYSPQGNPEVWAEKPAGYFTPEEWAADHPVIPPTPEEIAEAERSMAQMEASAIVTATLQRQAVQTMTFSSVEFGVFAKAGLFPEWAAGVLYEAGQRIVHDGVAYEVKQTVTAQAHQPPGSEGLLAVYRPISADPDSGVEPDGTLANPVPFLTGMDVADGKYYSYNGRTYLAKADMKPCVWPPDTAGLWQWEVTGG